MTLADDIRKDQTGTSDYHWIGDTLMAKEFGEVVELCDVQWSELDEFKAEHKRRIARLPDLEDKYLRERGAAYKLAEACENLSAAIDNPMGRPGSARVAMLEALAVWHIAAEEG